MLSLTDRNSLIAPLERTLENTKPKYIAYMKDLADRGTTVFKVDSRFSTVAKEDLKDYLNSLIKLFGVTGEMDCEAILALNYVITDSWKTKTIALNSKDGGSAAISHITLRTKKASTGECHICWSRVNHTFTCRIGRQLNKDYWQDIDLNERAKEAIEYLTCFEALKQLQVAC